MPAFPPNASTQPLPRKKVKLDPFPLEMSPMGTTYPIGPIGPKVTRRGAIGRVSSLWCLLRRIGPKPNDELLYATQEEMNGPAADSGNGADDFQLIARKGHKADFISSSVPIWESASGSR